MNSHIENNILERINSCNKKDIPVIAFLLDKNKKIVAYGSNNQYNDFKITGHAEINVIEYFCNKKKILNLSEYSLLCTMEPCLMCLGAIINAKIKKIYYYLENNKTGFLVSNHTFDLSKIKIEKINNIKLKNIIKSKFNFFFKNLR